MHVGRKLRIIIINNNNRMCVEELFHGIEKDATLVEAKAGRVV